MDFYAILSVFGIILAACFGIMIFSALLACLGFRPAGVVANSCASGWQSTIGNVAKGSSFAILQSISALGYLASWAGLAFIIAVAIIVASIYLIYFDDGRISSSIGNKTEVIWNDSTAYVTNITNDLPDLSSISNKISEISPNFTDISEKVSTFAGNVKEDIQPQLTAISEKVSTFAGNVKEDVQPHLTAISQNITSIWNRWFN